MWDRNTSIVMNVPTKSQSYSLQDSNGNWNIRISSEDFQKSRMAMNQYPVLLHNSQIDSFITKEFLNDIENASFANHPILRLNQLSYELSQLLRDFSRHVVDNLKPSGNFLQSKAGIIVIAIIIFFVVIVIVMGGPTILNAIKTGLEAGGGATASVAQAAQTIKPLG